MLSAFVLLGWYKIFVCLNHHKGSVLSSRPLHTKFHRNVRTGIA